MAKKPYFNNFILVGVIAGIVALLDYIGVVGFPIGVFSVSAFYIGGAFFTAFAIWFGLWGLLAIYLGLLIGALLSGTFTVFAFGLALGNVIGAALPMLAFKLTKLNYELKSALDYVGYILSAVIGQNLISAAWTLGGFVLVGIMPSEAAKAAAYGWIIGGVIVQLVIGIPLLKFVSPLVKRTSMVKKKLL